MKNNKKRSIIGLIVVLIAIAACAYVAIAGVGKSRQGSAGNIKLGLDLAGGVSITYEAATENPSAADMADTVYKLQRRVEVYSTDAEVYQEGSNRITVEIPGEFDAEAVLENLGNPGSVGFYEEASEDSTAETEAETDTETESESDVTDGMNQVLSGEDIADAQAVSSQDTYGNSTYAVRLILTDEGATKFKEATARNIGSRIYIIYDGEIISYPTVNETISGGEATITGDFDYTTANSLATTIRLGTLSLELKEVRSNVVGAKLGEQAVTSSLQAGAIGIVLVILFMIVVYLVPGFASGIALILYVLMMLCFLNALDITLTLPGIAGIILSIGMAVDANVIIFARIREELAAEKELAVAIKTGFSKATSAILDGNITTLIAATVLYFKGSGTIKGFATTLALGIILSMFTALVITRVVLSGLNALGLNKEKLYGKTKVRKTINFTGKRVIFYVISLAIILLGVIMMGVKESGGEGMLNYSLEFTGGTSMTVALNENIDVTGEAGDTLRTLIEEKVQVNDIQLQNVAESNDIIIKTPVLDSEQRATLKDALTEQYGVEETSITEESISAVISDEMKSDATLAVVIAAICILIYIWIRFKDVKVGLSAIIALLHDILIVLTVYAVIRIPVGNTFIACMLTIVGYSINATIVVFDRIRENRSTMKADLAEIVNTSITQTLNRSINTTITTFITIFVLYLMGVTSIKEFALPLMAGIICGAYSSVCIAGTLWYTLKGKAKNS